MRNIVIRMMTDIVWCIWIFEVFGYYGHRILHTRSLYKYHKVEATHRAAPLTSQLSLHCRLTTTGELPSRPPPRTVTLWTVCWWPLCPSASGLS